LADRSSKSQTEKAAAPAPKTAAGPVQGNVFQPLSMAPALQSAADALTLQRAIGNRRTSQLIQAKLTVGAAHDPLEQEADRVAEQVVNRSSIQRNPEEDELQAMRIQRAPEDEDELMTKRSDMLGSFDAGGDFESKLSASPSGAPLDGKTRSQMESGIGADFSGVRVHTGAHASSLNRSISARAFTRGSDVFFDKGQYNPGSIAGKRLIAHELTHVVQQGGAPQSTQRKAYPGAIQRWPWSKKNKAPDADAATTPSADQGAKVDDNASAEMDAAASNDTPLSIAPDYSNSTVKDQAPTRFKFTVLVWLQNQNYLYMQKVRAWTMARNTLRSAAHSAGVGNLLGIRKAKTSAEMKTKTARKVAELDPAFAAKQDAEKAAQIKLIEGQTREMGHTWSRLTAYAGDEVKDIYSFGFWPANGISRPDEATEGDVAQPDHEHDKDSPLRVMHYDIPAKNYKAALRWADGQVQNPPQYKMIGLNCTSWSKLLAGKAGVSFPSSGNVFPAQPAQGFMQRIFSPNKAYNDIGKQDGFEDKIDAVPSNFKSFAFAPQEEVGGGYLKLPPGKTLTLRSMGGDDLTDLHDGTRIKIDDPNYPNVDDWMNVMVKLVGNNVLSSNRFGVLYASELKAYYRDSSGGGQTQPDYELPEVKSIHTLTGSLPVKTSRGTKTVPAGLKVMVTKVVNEDEIHVDSERIGASFDSVVRGTTDVVAFHAATAGSTTQ
jgi:hypothetical protein